MKLKCELLFDGRYWITRVITDTGEILLDYKWKDKKTAEIEYNRLLQEFVFKPKRGSLS